MMGDDEAIVGRVLAGDSDAFRDLVVRHQSAVCATVRALRPGDADCEDLAQDAFLAAFRHLLTFDPRKGSFRTWLLAIARNCCRNARPRPASIQVDAGAVPADERTPEVLACESEWRQRLDAGLAALSDDQRLAFVLVELQGLSLKEAADIAEIAVGTLKSRLFRAKLWLRETLRHSLID